MHYYKKNIGDYAKKTGRLTLLQHGAYTVLIDSCYDRERFPTMDEAMDWAWATTQEERDAVAFVLDKFFALEGEVYVQNRIKEELEHYHQKAITNKQIAIEREEKRRQNITNRAPVVNEPPPNHKPITTNQEPVITTGVAKATKGTRWQKGFALPDDWIEFCKKQRNDLEPKKVFEEFTDYWVSVAGAKGVKLDWSATWRNWVRNQKAGTKPTKQAWE